MGLCKPPVISTTPSSFYHSEVKSHGGELHRASHVRCQPGKDSLLNFPISAVPRPLSAGTCPATTPDACFFFFLRGGGQPTHCPSLCFGELLHFLPDDLLLHCTSLSYPSCRALQRSRPHREQHFPGGSCPVLWGHGSGSRHQAAGIGHFELELKVTHVSLERHLSCLLSSATQQSRFIRASSSVPCLPALGAHTPAQVGKCLMGDSHDLPS